MNNKTLRQDQTILQNDRHYFALSEIDGRNTNDDSFCISSIVPNIDQSPVYLLTVADGMGGYEHGKDVSEQAIRQLNSAIFDRLTISPNLNQFPTTIDLSAKALSAILWDGICQAHAYIQRMIRNNRWDKAGTTLVAALIYQETAIIANIGDSPLFYYQNSTKTLAEITTDHSVTGGLLRGKMITPEQAAVHYMRNQLEFYIGAESIPDKSTVQIIPLSPGDLLLLCSDGISGMLEPEQLLEIINQEDLNLEDRSTKLLTAARNAGATDNKTLILWQQLIVDN